MEKSVSTAKTLKIQFDLHTRLYNNALEGVLNIESDERLSDKVNHVKWLAGHLLATRMGMHSIGGFEKDTSFDEFFSHGKPISNDLKYPSIEVIKEKWNVISPKISTGLDQLPESALEADAPFQLPVADPSFRGYLAFLIHHEAYHIGQIGILRKYLGHKAMKYS